MNVPFLDLKAQYSSIKEEINQAIQEVLDSCAFAGGPFVEKFEREWAAYCGVKHAIGVGNGTDALWLILLALGVGRGDEVITVPNSFIATAEAIVLAGADPVFVDIEEECYTMNSALLEAAITPRTKAIIPVHIFGQTADMDPIMDVAKNHGLHVVEDACQAHGAEYKGRKAGSIGTAAAFSFYPGKNLGAYGEAGAVTTNIGEMAARIRMFRDHGQSKKYYHDVMGWNARMDGIQGAVLSVKLRHLDVWNAKRMEHAAAYAGLLREVPALKYPQARSDSSHVYHVYAARVPRRDEVIAALKQKGISSAIHYPIPIHQQLAARDLSKDARGFRVCERVAQEVISLPMFPEMEMQQIRATCQSLVEILHRP
jgi:dTDP-4-amino-4,6-dideoxygalactose transaminase